MILLSLILAHGWYPQHCCANRDCHPVPCVEMTELPNGGWEWQNKIFMKEKVSSSQDAKCHVCVYNDQPLCAFIQVAS